MPGSALLRAAAALATAVLAHSAVLADDVLKVSVGGRAAFESQVAEVGREQGTFKRHGLALEMRTTQSDGETLAAVVSGAADVGISAGTLATLAAVAKGAPVRVIGSAMIGATEFWYVPANSRIKTTKDAAGKSVAYSASGTPTSLMVLGLQELSGIKLKAVPTGDPAATLALVMSGKVDVGYSVPPFYDSLLAKLICQGRDRQEALRRMQVALESFIIEGVTTTIPFLARVMANKHFQEGAVDTKFLEREGSQLMKEPLSAA